MKRILIIGIISLCFFLSILGQEWAPIGAKWYYDYSDDQSYGYLLIESIKDTLIKNENCRVLKKTLFRNTGFHTINLEISGLPSEYTYEVNSKIYFYINDKFNFVYNFSPAIGDTLELINQKYLPGCDSTGKVVIESINKKVINNKSVNNITTRSISGNVAYNANVVENIGSLYYLLPTYFNCVADYLPYGPLRCYEDNYIGLYKNQTSIQCNQLTTDIKEYMSIHNVHLYNSNEGTYLRSNGKLAYLFQISDIAGKVCFKGQLNSFTTIKIEEISNILPGFYFLEIFLDKDKVFVQKFIIRQL